MNDTELMPTLAWALGALLFALTLPKSIIFPYGITLAVLNVLSGFILGLLTAAALLVYAFFRLTHPKPPSSPKKTWNIPPPQKKSLPLNQNKKNSLSAWLPGASSSSSSSQRHTSNNTTSHLNGTAAAGGTTYNNTTTNTSTNNLFEISDYTSLGPLPPHPYSKAGRFSGILYTAPLSKWGRGDIVMEWPPKPSSSPECPLSAWNATVDGNGTLVLEQIEAYIPPPPSAAAAAAAASASQSPKAAEDQASTNSNNNNAGNGNDNNKTATTLHSPRKVGIPLEGCKLELLTEGLEGRDSLSRRAPLLLTHPRWNLLDGEPGLYIFAPEAAVKQEWATALGWWCDGNKRGIRALEAVYSAYCLSMKKRSIIEYAHEGQLASLNGKGKEGGGGIGGGGIGGGQEDATPNPQKKKRRRKRDIFKLSSPEKALLPPRPESPLQPTLLEEEEEEEDKETQPSSSSTSPPPPPPPLPVSQQQQQQQNAPTINNNSNNATQHQPPKAPPTDLSIEAIMEARWMQSRKIPVPPVLPSTKASSSTSLYTTINVASGKGGKQDGTVLRPPAMTPHRQQQHTDGHTSNINNNNSSNNAPSAHPIIIIREEEEKDRSTVRTMDFSSKTNGGGGGGGGSSNGGRCTTVSPVKVVVATKVPDEEEGRVVTVELLSQNDKNDSGGVFGPLPQGLPPPLAIDYGANAFLTRLAFDMLRSTHFKDFITKRVCHQVSKLALPNYVQSLEVVDLDLGSTAPTISNLASLAAPASDTIWPQILFDLSYVGEFTIVLETKIELREASGWERLETVLEKVGGGGGGKKKKEEEGEDGDSTYTSRGGSPECDDNNGIGDDNDIEDEDESSQSKPQSQPTTPASSSSSKQPSLKSALFSELRRSTAHKLRKWAESTATHISKYPLRIKLTFTRLEGRAIVWIPPPPGNRLFFSFLAPPRLSVKGKPEVAGRLLKYGYHVSRANNWLESQMRKALQKSMVFPGGADIPIPGIFGGDAGDIDNLFPKNTDNNDNNNNDDDDGMLPGLERYLKKVAEQGGEELPMGVDGAGLAEAARMVLEGMMMMKKKKKGGGGEGESGGDGGGEGEGEGGVGNPVI